MRGGTKLLLWNEQSSSVSEKEIPERADAPSPAPWWSRHANSLALVGGFLLAFGEIVLNLLSGDDVVDAVWPHAVRSLGWTMALRASPALPFTLAMVLGIAAFFGRGLVQRSPHQGRLEVGLHTAVGFLLGLLSIHFVMDAAYLRGAFLLLPTLYGWTLAVLLVVVGGLPTWRSTETGAFSWPKTAHLVGVFFAAWLVMPGIPALVGMAPAPPDAPRIGYGSTPGPYDTLQFSSPYTLPEAVVAVQGDLEDDVTFSVHLTLPDLPDDTPLATVPLAVLLHGFGYPDVDAYQAWITHLAAKGIAVAFLQYPSDLRPEGHESFDERYEEGTSNFLQHTYRNLSVRAAMDHLEMLALREPRDERIDQAIGDVMIDPSSLWVGGHSLGAAYTFLSLDEAFDRGWGQHALVVALEAPASRPMQVELQHDFTRMPTNTLVQIAVSEDDMSVGICPGAFHQQQFASLPEERNQLIVVRTDKYGFPRLVASHYMQTDPAHDRLSDWGFYRRIDAQADYIVAQGRNDTFTADFAFQYMTDETMLTGMGQWEDGTPVLPLKLFHDGLNTDAMFEACT